MSDKSIPSFRQLCAPGVAAVRRFWRPFLLLQGCALALVVAYFKVPAIQHVCQRLSDWHDRGGLFFSAMSAAIAGGLLPEVAKMLAPATKGSASPTDELAAAHTRRLNDIVFAFFAFAGSGVIIDLQYRGLGRVFGYDGTMLTSIKKMLADQFITTPIYGTVYWSVVYRWRALRYSAIALAREFSWRWYLLQVVPLLLPGWCFWIPMVLLIYTMPASLQLCLFCLALAAWSLLRVFIATRVEEIEPTVANDDANRLHAVKNTISS